MIPRATYRVQFHAGFPFAAAIPLIGYWKQLGISHLYSSPIATARAGSNHGYDVVDPTRINPELGGEDGFRALVAALQAEGMGLILDIVPNHVAVGHGDNGWWLDVLHKGRASAHAGTFDIDWDALDGKILAPFLGAPYAEVLANGDLALERIDGRLAVTAYGEHVFPLRPEDQSYQGPVTHELLERQHWRLAWWRSANDAINWRRFFDITELAGIRAEDPAVFEAVHALPLRLYREGLIQGVRVDHVDGLADPPGYCRKLRETFGPDAYIVVEKILAAGEMLPADWAIDGTSGYDFLNEVSALLHDPAGAEPLGTLWRDLSGRTADFAPEEAEARQWMVTRGFAGQLDACAGVFARLAASEIATRDFALPALRRAIGWLLEGFEAYRHYGAAPSPLLDHAAERARALAGPAEAFVVDRVAGWLAGDGPGDPALIADAARRFQQLSAPIAAKSVEDTAFYRYGRLLSRNDVGCDPDRLGETPTAFARTIAARAAAHPHAMLATATHDHKRGEDARMRIAVLSELPGLWAPLARRWGEDAPIDRGDATMLHQMIVGAWPVDLAADDAEGLSAFAERLSGWQQKALREAKLRSSWAAPDEAYEAAAADYLRALLAPHAAFAAEARAFALKIAPAGMAKSLVQAALRCTLPGVPDLFQGREGWDLSLVDPDNRRPVDYPALEAMLDREGVDWRDGSLKQRVIAGLLGLRAAEPALFETGRFEPLTLSGTRQEEALAFARHHGDRWIAFVCGLRCSAACVEAGSADPGEGWWGGTTVELPNGGTLPVTRITAGRAYGHWPVD
jgi:(1->4)-alpha-D-glucan 1-alpha-D-glucosylmutase